MKLIYNNGVKIENPIDVTRPPKLSKNSNIYECAEYLSTILKNMHESSYKSNVIYRPPPQESKVCGIDELGEEMAAGMRLQSCAPRSDTEPLLFFGTKKRPDPELLALVDINPFTDKQWQIWKDTDKRQLLLQCPCLTETVIEDPIHDLAACYEYHATSLEVLRAELKPLIKELLGIN